jgi:hypothetical protein
VNIQFIIVTNSCALIDEATTEELFMLMPSRQLANGSNQLVEVPDVSPPQIVAYFNDMVIYLLN